jgi:hypothetical protein
MPCVQLDGHHYTVSNDLIKACSRCINKGTATIAMPPPAMRNCLIFEAEKKAKSKQNARRRSAPESPLKQAVNAPVIINPFGDLSIDLLELLQGNSTRTVNRAKAPIRRRQIDRSALFVSPMAPTRSSGSLSTLSIIRGVYLRVATFSTQLCKPCRSNTSNLRNYNLLRRRGSRNRISKEALR